MTAWSLELMDITRRWISSFLLLCQAFTAVVFSCCWAFLSGSGDWLENIPLLCINKFLGCFGCMFWVIVHPCYETPPDRFGWIWADSMSLNTSQFIRLLLSCVTSSINTSDAEPLAAMHAPAITLPPLCFTDDVVCFRLWAVPRLHHAFYHHPGRSWSWFHLSKESSTRSELVFFKICFSKVQSSLSIHEAYEWTVQWTFCIYFHAVFSL